VPSENASSFDRGCSLHYMRQDSRPRVGVTEQTPAMQGGSRWPVLAKPKHGQRLSEDSQVRFRPPRQEELPALTRVPPSPALSKFLERDRGACPRLPRLRSEISTRRCFRVGRGAVAYAEAKKRGRMLRLRKKAAAGTVGQCFFVTGREASRCKSRPTDRGRSRLD
jgi:hypothetical protein